MASATASATARLLALLAFVGSVARVGSIGASARGAPVRDDGGGAGSLPLAVSELELSRRRLATCPKSDTCAKTRVDGPSHSLELQTDCTVRSWGRGAEGQLGHGVFVPGGVLEQTCSGDASLCFVKQHRAACDANPTLCSGATDKLQCVEQVAVGGRHSVLLLQDGTVVTFGAGRAGQLGHGAANYNEHDDPNVAAPNGNLPRAQQLLWLGQAKPTWWWNNPNPQPAEWGKKVTQVAAGDAHTVLLMDDTTVRSFGMGTYWQLGHWLTTTQPDHTNINIAKKINKRDGTPYTNVVEVRAGSFDTTLIFGTAPRTTAVLSHMVPIQLEGPDTSYVADTEREVTLPEPNAAAPVPSPAAVTEAPKDETNVVGNSPLAGCCDGFGKPLAHTPTGKELKKRHYSPSHKVFKDVVEMQDRKILENWEADAATKSRLTPRFYCDDSWFYYDPTQQDTYPDGRGRFRTGEYKIRVDRDKPVTAPVPRDYERGSIGRGAGVGFPRVSDWTEGNRFFDRADDVDAKNQKLAWPNWQPMCPPGTRGATDGTGATASAFTACKKGFERKSITGGAFPVRACMPTEAYVRDVMPDIAAVRANWETRN